MAIQRFGKYEAERRLGSGGFATVWLAYDRDLDIRVAIKLLADNYIDDAEVRRRFLQEARILSHLLHPGIVRIFTADTLDDGRPYFVMEYAEGGSLYDLIRLRRQQGASFSIEEAIAISLKIADGLSAAHQRRIIHRDLKPSNVLLADATNPASGRLMLADFGIARQLEAASSTTITAGTLAYMAPEQADPERAKSVDQRSDIYAAAVVLYELLEGTVPRHFDSLSAFVRTAPGEMAQPVKIVRPDVPGALARVIETGLAWNPEERFASAQAWSQALRAATATAPLPLPHDDEDKTRDVAELTIQKQILGANGQPLAAAALAGFTYVVTPLAGTLGAPISITTGSSGSATAQIPAGTYVIAEAASPSATFLNFTVDGNVSQSGIFTARSGRITSIIASGRTTTKAKLVRKPAAYAGAVFAVGLIALLVFIVKPPPIGCGCGPAPPVFPTLFPTSALTTQPTSRPTVRPTVQPTVAPTVPPTVAPTSSTRTFSWDFSRDTGDWFTGNDGTLVALLSGGQYSIRFLKPALQHIFTPRSVAATGDQGIKADVLLRGGYAGLVVRFGTDSSGQQSYYDCYIDTSDNYTCDVQLANRQRQIVRGPTASSLIQDGQANTLELIVSSNTVEFWINGTKVTTFDDNGVVAGQPGLLVGGYSGSGSSTPGSAAFASVTVVVSR